MAGTDRAKIETAEGPAIILVEPQLGDNIGMVARAMANFGLSELRLVNPRDGWPNPRANAAASGADYVVEAATVYATLAEAIADLKFVYATTARPRDMIKQVLAPDEAAGVMREHLASGSGVGLLFGRERWGLNNEEVAIADAIVTFPVNPGFASLNIAQAVLLMAHEWRRSAGGERSERQRGEDHGFAMEGTPATRRELQALLDHLESALEEAKYFYPPERREKMWLNVTGIFTHMRLSEEEMRTMHGIVAALERRWQKGRDGVD